MSTVNDLLVATLKLIGAVAKTETAAPDEIADAFARLNDMVDAWQADRVTIFGVVRSVYNLTSGQSTYTIGAGGNFNAVRPIFIQDAGIITTTSNPVFELPVRILTVDEFAQISIKTQQSTLAWYLYYDYAYDPNGRGNIQLYPVPSVGTLQLALYVPTPIAQFTSINQTIGLPPGYAEALRYNLAVRLCPEFGKKVDPVVAALAMESFGTIARANTRLQNLGMDPMLIGDSKRSVFNFLTGESL